MKKKNLILLALLVITFFFLSATIAWSQTNTDTAPSFDQQPSIVLDLWKNGGKGKYKDYVKITNATLKQNISFNVYGYDQKSGKWNLIGSARLKNHSDFDTVNSPWKGKMGEFRWFAIHSLDNIKFDAQAVPFRSDVSVTVFEIITAGPPPSNDNAPTFEMQSSIVMDLWENGNKGKYKDNINLTNGSKNQNLSFNVYGYDQKNNQWILIGPKRFTSDAPDSAAAAWGWAINPDSVDSAWNGRLNEFQWIAIQSLNGASFDVQAVANRNDLTIMVVDK